MADQYFVNTGKLNLRSAGDETASIVAVLARGQILDATAPPANGWLEVTTSAGFADLHGFVSTDYVFAVNAPPAVVTDTQVTRNRLTRLTPTGKGPILDAIEQGFVSEAPGFGIAQNALRICHFLAQAAHESMGFTHLHELGGPSYWRRYDGRTDLGNLQPGDGARFHGRGIFQLTGRANYRAIGAVLGLDLVGNPDLAADPAVAFRIACRFWSTRGLNDLADRDDVRRITLRINGGTNGLAERTMLLARARSIWG